jgi:hypothetical protein
LGAKPNKKTNNGVISEPPPTPVKPTNTPTSKPETIYPNSIKQSYKYKKAVFLLIPAYKRLWRANIAE